MADVGLLTVPYHLGHEGIGMGAGPGRLIEAGAEAAIAKAGHRVCGAERVMLDHDRGHEMGNTFAILGLVAARVRAIREQGIVPIVLGGNCSSAIGVIAGMKDAPIGIIWFDAHGDANTPETTVTGYFEGMPLAVITGWCWGPMAASIPGFIPVPEERVVHVGGRAFDEREWTRLSGSAITVVNADALRKGGGLAMAAPIQRVAAVDPDIVLHVDLDVIDRADGIASEYAEAGGAPIQEIEAAIDAIGSACRVQAVVLASYNPTVDLDGRALRAGLRLLAASSRLIGI